MLSSVRCPTCREPFAAAEDAAVQADFLTCPRCGRSVNLTELPAAAPGTDSFPSDIPAKSQEDETEAVAEEVAPSLAEPSSRSPKRLLRRIVLVAWLIVLLMLLGLSLPFYRFVRDRYNPWLTEENCKRIQTDMSLEEVEAIVSKGKPCSPEDVKAIVDPINNRRREMEQMIQGQMNRGMANMLPIVQSLMRPQPPNEPADRAAIEAKADDVIWQAKRQKVASWYRWKRGDTLLFVGVSTENKVRLVYRITDSSDLNKAGISAGYAVYPFADMELIERTGKSEAAMLPEEKIVEAYIRSKAAEPDSVEINRWGPHDLKGELVTVPGYQLVGERRSKPVIKVRVRYWIKGPKGNPELNDHLFYLQDGEVFGFHLTPFGNSWFEKLRDLEQQLHLRR